MADNQAEVDKRSAEQSKAAQDADKKRQEDVRKQVQEQRAEREKNAANNVMLQAGDVKPTPTQEENDLAASGVHIPEHEADGSPEQDTSLNLLATPGRDLKDHKESKPGSTTKQSYATRETTPNQNPRNPAS